MARSKAASVGHNSGAPLTDEEVAALQVHFSLKIRAQQRKAGVAKSAYDLERNEVNALFTSARAELGLTRKEFEEVLALQDMTETEFLAHEGKRRSRLLAQGLPVGTQLDMFEHGDTADDKALAEADGYRAGRRADDPVPPKHVAPMFHPDWMAGWHRGQEENAMQLQTAQTVLANRAAPAGELAPDEPEEDDETDEPDELEQARRLSEAGWTKPTAEEASFAAE